MAAAIVARTRCSTVFGGIGTAFPSLSASYGPVIGTSLGDLCRQIHHYRYLLLIGSEARYYRSYEVMWLLLTDFN
ncbi:hypothetical protein NXC24_PA00007 (plasmid) [Rhizobium sp. NXC24]|nr:hypothetical protein NXC24_PA00007 [Rhizobium sp. NXC24]